MFSATAMCRDLRPFSVLWAIAQRVSRLDGRSAFCVLNRLDTNPAYASGGMVSAEMIVTREVSGEV